ncbi:APC family permease [Arthrobacter sp. cf158]|uniref:APC family permease n=1 Tax=Arthrobacter sp. cf158 TaxID=1761744 RepID=UPI0020C8ABDE|nr:APC family permease [Arthrobacter sp. cf158]
MRDAFTLAFVFISPIVALYAVFGLVMQAAGPAGWWAFAIVLVLQLLIALSLGVLVSRWPFQGGSYQWARRLVGENYGWAAGWAYIWTIVIVIASNAYAIASFIPPLLSIPEFTLPEHILVALGILVLTTGLNLIGPVVLKILTRLSLAAEVIGSIVLATVLLIWHREQPFDILFTSGGAADGDYLWGGFILAIGFVGFGFAGFETVCSMAEEIENPEKNLPKAIVGALATIGIVVLYSSLALVLSTPDFGAVIAGAIVDPAANNITEALGPGIAQPFFALVIIGFAASMLTAQTSISRVIWSFSRDGVLPASKFLSKLSNKHRTPNRAIIVVGLLAVVITLLAFSEQVYATLIAAAAGGFFVTMGLVVVALLVRIVSKKWHHGPFTLGAFTLPVVIGAAGWIIFEIINLAWPRNPGDELPWYVSWSVPIGLAGIALVGLLVWLSVRDRIRNVNQDLHEHHEIAGEEDSQTTGYIAAPK